MSTSFFLAANSNEGFALRLSVNGYRYCLFALQQEADAGGINCAMHNILIDKYIFLLNIYM